MSTTYDRPQCWAYGPTGQRCQGQAGHEDDHGIVVNWSDDECVTPDHFVQARIIGETNTARPVPIIALDEDDDGEPSLDRCAACGWPEATHSANPHGCKSFA
jgi:hypothetical protein